MPPVSRESFPCHGRVSLCGSDTRTWSGRSVELRRWSHCEAVIWHSYNHCSRMCLAAPHCCRLAPPNSQCCGMNWCYGCCCWWWWWWCWWWWWWRWCYIVQSWVKRYNYRVQFSCWWTLTACHLTLWVVTVSSRHVWTVDLSACGCRSAEFCGSVDCQRIFGR